MTVSYTYHCDARECDASVRTREFMTEAGWLYVDEADDELHFCSWDCVITYGATRSPVEEYRP